MKTIQLINELEGKRISGVSDDNYAFFHNMIIAMTKLDCLVPLKTSISYNYDAEHPLLKVTHHTNSMDIEIVNKTLIREIKDCEELYNLDMIIDIVNNQMSDDIQYSINAYNYDNKDEIIYSKKISRITYNQLICNIMNLPESLYLESIPSKLFVSSYQLSYLKHRTKLDYLDDFMKYQKNRCDISIDIIK